MTFKDGKVFLQAGGGIVFDSVEEDEFVETINKLGANVKCIEEAESESFSALFSIYRGADRILQSTTRDCRGRTCKRFWTI